MTKYETFTDVFAETLVGEALLERGREEGREAGRREVLPQMLAHRFGELSSAELAAIEALPAAASDRLLVDIFDFESIDDVRQWLADNA